MGADHRGKASGEQRGSLAPTTCAAAAAADAAVVAAAAASAVSGLVRGICGLTAAFTPRWRPAVICRSSRGDVFQGFEPCALSAFLAVSLCRLVCVVRGSYIYTVKSGGGCGFCVLSFSTVVPFPRSLFSSEARGRFPGV